MGEHPPFIDSKRVSIQRMWYCPYDLGVWLTATCGFGATHEPVTEITTIEIVSGHADG